jgi:hypothetical protein
LAGAACIAGGSHDCSPLRIGLLENQYPAEHCSPFKTCNRRREIGVRIARRGSHERADWVVKQLLRLTEISVWLRRWVPAWLPISPVFIVWIGPLPPWWSMPLLKLARMVDTDSPACTAAYTVIQAFNIGYQGDAGFEMIFHQACHVEAIEQPLRTAINREAARQNAKAASDLWHAIIFYTAGELARRELQKSSHGNTNRMRTAKTLGSRMAVA